jgi:predicted component of type VI protein secretion system
VRRYRIPLLVLYLLLHVTGSADVEEAIRTVTIQTVQLQITAEMSTNKNEKQSREIDIRIDALHSLISPRMRMKYVRIQPRDRQSKCFHEVVSHGIEHRLKVRSCHPI